MMRFVLPAIVMSLGLHAGVLAYVGAPDAADQGAVGSVSSTVIVFDTLPAPAASATSEGEQVADQVPAEALETPVDLPVKEDVPAEVHPVEVAKAEPPKPEPETVETPKAEEPAVEPEPVVEPDPIAEVETEEPVAEPQPVAAREPVAEPNLVAEADPVLSKSVVPVPRVKPDVPTGFVQKAKQKPKKKAKTASRKKKAKKLAGTAKKKATRRLKTASTGRKKTRKKSGSAGRSGGASAGQKRAYARRVLSHIQRYKRHPAGGKSGKVRLAVRISSSGSLGGVSVRRSSGNRVLDRAAMATARRASPYPRPPGGKGFSFTVSLRYTR